MNLKLLTANDILLIKEFVDSCNFNNVFCNKTLIETINHDAAAIRNMIFQGVFVCVANMESDTIKQLLIIEKPQDIKSGNNVINVSFTTLNNEFINYAFEFIKTIYDLGDIYKLKIITMIDNKIEEVSELLKTVFKTEITVDIDHYTYLELGYSL